MRASHPREPGLDRTIPRLLRAGGVFGKGPDGARLARRGRVRVPHTPIPLESMAAAENEESWLHHNRRREERMRYEVLVALYEVCGRIPGCAIHFSRFAEDLGAWREELFRAVEWLDRKGYVRYHGAGPVVSMTEKGVDYVENGARNRKTIRD